MSLAVPTAEGITDGAKAIDSMLKDSKWILISPDGRLWENKDPMFMFAVIASVMRGEDLKFERN